MSFTAICCVLGALLRDNMLMDGFSLCIVTYIVDLLTRAHYLWLDCHVHVPLRKASLQFRFFFVFYCFTFCMHRNQSGSLVCWKTDAEDTYQPLTTTPLKLRVNNSSKFNYYLHARKNLQSFLFLYIFNSLVLGLSENKRSYKCMLVLQLTFLFTIPWRILEVVSPRVYCKRSERG